MEKIWPSLDALLRTTELSAMAKCADDLRSAVEQAGLTQIKATAEADVLEQESKINELQEFKKKVAS